ncbi:MAG TPA: hypothetical protein VKT70_13830 [Stellaceae bacterium]|nr:hypothetical protein [Stellaceae bacterium]
MALNTSQVRVIDPVLTTVAQGFTQPDLIGETILPAVPVDVSGGQILQFGKEAFMAYNLRRAPGGTTKRIEFGYLGQHYALLEDALEVKVPREWLRDASIVPGIDLGSRAVRLGLAVVKKSLESDIASLVLNPANYGPNNQIVLAGAAKWSNPAATPYQQILQYREAIRASVGIYPTLGVFSPQAWVALISNPSIITRFQFTSHDAITEDMIARLFQLDKVVVGKAVSSDDQGNFSDVWGNNCLLSYSPPDPTGPEQPSLGYTYTMRGNPLVEPPYYDNNAKSWIYPTGYERAPVIAAPGAAFLIQQPN